MQKDPSRWPQIYLQNKLTLPDGSIAYSGSSSLCRLPNGVVVMPTAGHLFQPGELANFHNAFKSWVVMSRDHPSAGIPMTQAAMDPANPSGLDLGVLAPRSQRENWPALVLPIRQEPLQPGDVVYLVAVPFDDKSAQKVFPGVVISRTNDNEIQYNVEGKFNTQGCSGAPVIDEYGRWAGVNIAHLNEQTIPDKMQLICIDSATVLTAIKLPDNVKAADVKLAPVPTPVAAATTKPDAGAASSPAAPAVSEDPADAALRSAKLFLDNKIYDKAKVKLQSIIDTYPDSDAAKQAKDLLSQIPDPADQ
jgi:hypothetical protein